MKIVCDQCGAKYSVDDSKIQNKSFKITCKKCNNKITVKKDDDFEKFPDEDSSQMGNTNWDENETEHEDMQFDDQATKIFNYAEMNETDTQKPKQEVKQETKQPSVEWYIHINGKQEGPLSQKELEQMIQAKGVPENSNVWKAGMAEWALVKDIPELAKFFPKTTKPSVNPFGNIDVQQDAFGKASLLDDADAESLFKDNSLTKPAMTKQSLKTNSDNPFGEDAISSSFNVGGNSGGSQIDLKSLIGNNDSSSDDEDSSSKSKVIDFRDIAGNSARKVVVQHATFNAGGNVESSGKKFLIIGLVALLIVAVGAVGVVFMMMGNKTFKVTLISDPAGANLFINNEPKGVTGGQVELDKGTYTIKITKDGYDDVNTALAISGDTVQSYKLEEKQFSITIESTPEALVAINGENKGNSPQTLKLKKGEYNLTLTKEGFEQVQGKLEVNADAKQTFTLEAAKTTVATNDTKTDNTKTDNTAKTNNTKVNKNNTKTDVAVKDNTKVDTKVDTKINTKKDDIDDLLGDNTKVVKKDENLPDTLTKDQVLGVMKGVAPKVKDCGAAAGVTGTIKVKFQINGSGAVSNIEILDDAGDAANCITSKIRGLKFDKFGGKAIPVTFPFKM